MTILLFGITKDIVGSSTISMPSSSEFKAGKTKTVGDLRNYLNTMYPEFKNLSSLAIAVNNTYAEDHLEIDIYDEIALIPPVSGG